MLPTGLYEALPAIYAASGVAAVWAADNVIGLVSGVVLLAAAVAIARMRWTYRSRG